MSSATKNPAICLDSVVGITNDQISAQLDDEMVILGYQSGVYYGLDEVGLFVWNLLQQPRKVSEIYQAVLADYDVQPAECEQDILLFLAELQSKQLVMVTNEPVA